MAKGYIGIDGVAKNVKNIYIGVGGVAKQVKKAYIGVGGVAKLWYTSTRPITDFIYLLANPSSKNVVGSNVANAGSVYYQYSMSTSGVYYVFVFRDKMLCIAKIQFYGNTTTPTLTVLNGTAPAMCRPNVSQVSAASGNVWQVTSVKGLTQSPENTSGGTLAFFQYENTGFSESDIDEILSQIKIYTDTEDSNGTYHTGVESNTATTMQTTPPYLYTGGMPYFVAIGSNLAFNVGNRPRFSTAAPILTDAERSFVKYTSASEPLKAAIGGSVASVYRGSMIGFYVE